MNQESLSLHESTETIFRTTIGEETQGVWIRCGDCTRRYFERTFLTFTHPATASNSSLGPRLLVSSPTPHSSNPATSDESSNQNSTDSRMKSWRTTQILLSVLATLLFGLWLAGPASANFAGLL